MIAPGGAHLVTFDNWAGIGVGGDVIVIYDATGRLVRSLELRDFLPDHYIRALPWSFGSIYWAGEHHFSDDGRRLILSVNIPGDEGDIFGTEHCLRDRASDRPYRAARTASLGDRASRGVPPVCFPPRRLAASLQQRPATGAAMASLSAGLCRGAGERGGRERRLAPIQPFVESPPSSGEIGRPASKAPASLGCGGGQRSNAS